MSDNAVMSKSAIALFIVIALSAIAAVVWLTTRRPTQTQVPPTKTLPTVSAADDYVRVTQDGKVTSPGKLLTLFKRNPNRFELTTSTSDFLVAGRIERVNETNQALDRISGFYVPLRVAELPKLIDEGPSSVSLFVQGLTRESIATLNAGDLVEAKCPKVRAFNESLVFDQCALSRNLK